MSNDFPYNESPTLKDFLAEAEAKGIDIMAEVNREQIINPKPLPILKPKPFPRGEGPIITPAVPKGARKARKRRRKLQRQARRRNR